MKFEVLKRSHLKRNIIIGIFVVATISACILTFTRAKYRTTESIQVAEGNINYKVPDFNMVALYIENELGEYEEANTIPSSGYTLNMTESYCGQSQDGEIVKDNTVSFIYENGSMTFSNVTKKGTKCYLYFDEYKVPLLADAILKGKDIQTRSDFSVVLTDDTTGIIYQTSDNDGTSYYFAGDTEENWMRFGGFYWRVIRINGDGSIRMIYAGADTGSVTIANRTGATTQISLDGSTTTYAFNTEYNRSEYVGLRYSRNTQHGSSSNSAILNTINTWYTTNISSSDREHVDTNAWFCSDRASYSNTSGTTSSWVSTGSTVYYAGYVRLITNKVPTLQCSNSDMITTSNGAGLITADEASMAGGAYARINRDYYLYTVEQYWTMSPANYDSGTASMFYVHANSTLNTGVVNDEIGIRPVINLKADTTTTGTGTSTDPFVVS